MSELDPRLAELLRRAPAPPTTLDEGHRQVVLASARQSWFRRRARRRRNLIGLACAALFATAIAGWTIRSLVDSPVATAEPAMAISERKERADPVMPVAAPPPALATPAPTAVAAAAPAMADVALEQDSSLARKRVAIPAEAGAPAAAGLAAAPKPQPAGRSVATASAPHGRVVVARLVVEAVQAGRLPPADRRAALQAALDSLAGLEVAEAEALRLRLTGLLRQ